jgi:hypothetical protein
MRRMIVVALALVLGTIIAACTGTSGHGTSGDSMSDKSTSDKSMHTGGSRY